MLEPFLQTLTVLKLRTSIDAASVLRRCTLVFGALFFTSAWANDRAPLAHAGIYRSVDDAVKVTLSTFPAGAALSPENEWWASVDAVARPQLESTRERARQQVEDLFRDHSTYSFNDFDAWFSAVGKASIGLSERLVRGDWKCRNMHVNGNGVLALPFNHCVVRRRGSCLELAKESGRRWAGCLHRVDANNFALVQTRQYYQEITRVDGFLSASSASHLRLVVARPNSLDIYEFIRR